MVLLCHLSKLGKAAQQYKPSYQKAQIGVEVSQSALTANRSALLPSLDAVQARIGVTVALGHQQL